MTKILLEELASYYTAGTPPQESQDKIVVKTFEIRNFSTMSVNVNTPITPMPLPEEGAEKNVLVKIEGNSETISLTWTIKDESSTVVTGKSVLPGEQLWSNTDGNFSILTSQQQINYLTDPDKFLGFQPKSIDQTYRLRILDDSNNEIFTRNGFLTKFDFNIRGDSPVVWQATVNFIVGDVVTSYQTKIPRPPTGLTLTAAGSGQVDISWTAPTITNGTITDYKITYFKDGDVSPYSVWTNSNTTSYSLTGLTVGKQYGIRVTAYTNIEGYISNPEYIVVT